jgi:predicted RNA-binding Zn-ribbon protein involved in translation (DUF1610 family)
MDDLDRLYQRLLDAVREGAPHLRERRFRLGDIPQHLLPYRLHRRELGFESVQQYERALARLAAGERGYLSADATVHDAFRRAAADPDTPLDQLLRTFGDTPVALAPDSRHRPGDPTAATPARPVAAVDPRPDEPSTGEIPVPAAAASASTREDGPGGAPGVGTGAGATPLVIPVVRTNGAALPAAPAPTAPTAPSAPRPDADLPTVTMPFSARPPAQVVGGTCPHCGRPLPVDRGVTFCPYCGENLTVRRCPACSTELEAGWRFCITCGRQVDEPVGGAGP